MREPREIDLPVPRARRVQSHGSRRGAEARGASGDHGLVDFVAGSRHVRSDHGDGAIRIGCDLAQRLERRREHARREPAPPCVYGSDCARRSRHQHRKTIGGDDADRKSGNVADERIRLVGEGSRHTPSRARPRDRAPGVRARDCPVRVLLRVPNP